MLFENSKHNKTMTGETKGWEQNSIFWHHITADNYRAYLKTEAKVLWKLHEHTKLLIVDSWELISIVEALHPGMSIVTFCVGLLNHYWTWFAFNARKWNMRYYWPRCTLHITLGIALTAEGASFRLYRTESSELVVD